MTYKEALKFWKDDLQNVEACVEYQPRAFYQELHDAFKIGIEAIEKQIPKKRINKDALLFGRCPACNAALLNMRYCCVCGQAIDWSEEE